MAAMVLNRVVLSRDECIAGNVTLVVGLDDKRCVFPSVSSYSGHHGIYVQCGFSGVPPRTLNILRWHVIVISVRFCTVGGTTGMRF